MSNEYMRDSRYNQRFHEPENYFDRMNPSCNGRSGLSYITEQRPPRRVYADDDQRSNFYEEGFRRTTSAILFDERPSVYRYENEHLHRSQNYDNNFRYRNFN
jgi:hypothetical protein